MVEPKAKVFCNTGCRRRREQGRRKRLQERLEPKWRTDYSLRVRTPHDLSVRVLWLEWQWPLPVAYALFLLASCFLKRVAVAAPFCHSHRVPWKGLGHWARDPTTLVSERGGKAMKGSEELGHATQAGATTLAVA